MSHHHDHSGHGHTAQHCHARDRRSLQFALLLTFVIFIAQLIGGYLSNSLALLSDAGHMLTDTAALFISLLAMRIALRPRDSYPRRFTYGLRRVEILAALLNGLSLLAICLYIVIESIGRFMAPEAIHTPTMLVVALVGLVANVVSAYLLHGSESMNTRSAYLHVVADLLSSVGVIVGGLLIHFTDTLWIDPLLSLLIALVIIRSALRVIREASAVLMESAPANIDVEELRKTLLELGWVQDLHDLHVWQLGATEAAVSAHVVVGRDQNSDDRLRTIRELLKTRFKISHSTIQIETEDFAAGEDCSGCDC